MLTQLVTFSTELSLSYRADWISELSVWLTFSNTSLWLQESWSPRFASAHTLAPSSTASCSPPRARHYNLRARKGKHRVKASSRSFQYTVFSYLSRSYPKHYCIHKYETYAMYLQTDEPLPLGPGQYLLVPWPLHWREGEQIQLEQRRVNYRRVA